MEDRTEPTAKLTRKPGETHCGVCGAAYNERRGMDCPEIHADEAAARHRG